MLWRSNYTDCASNIYLNTKTKSLRVGASIKLHGRSQVDFQPSSNNSRVVLSEHQHVIIPRSESYPKGHVCIVRKEFKNNSNNQSSERWKSSSFFFSLKIIVYTPKSWKHYFGIVALSTCLWHSNWVFNNSYRTSGAL